MEDVSITILYALPVEYDVSINRYFVQVTQALTKCSFSCQTLFVGYYELLYAGKCLICFLC